MLRYTYFRFFIGWDLTWYRDVLPCIPSWGFRRIYPEPVRQLPSSSSRILPEITVCLIIFATFLFYSTIKNFLPKTEVTLSKTKWDETFCKQLNTKCEIVLFQWHLGVLRGTQVTRDENTRGYPLTFIPSMFCRYIGMKNGFISFQ